MYIERLGFDPDTVQKLSFVEMLKRIGPGIILTGMPIIHAIRHYYGKGAAAFVGICLFLEGCECRIETAPSAADCHDRMLSVYPGSYDLRHLQEILKTRENCGDHSRFSFFF